MLEDVLATNVVRYSALTIQNCRRYLVKYRALLLLKFSHSGTFTESKQLQKRLMPQQAIKSFLNLIDISAKTYVIRRLNFRIYLETGSLYRTFGLARRVARILLLSGRHQSVLVSPWNAFRSIIYLTFGTDWSISLFEGIFWMVIFISRFTETKFS